MHWILLDPFKFNLVINVLLINAVIVISIILPWNIWLKWFNILMHILIKRIGKWEVWVWVDDICGGSSNSTRIPFIFRSILLWKSSIDFLTINKKIIGPLISETIWNWTFFPHTILICGLPPMLTKSASRMANIVFWNFMGMWIEIQLLSLYFKIGKILINHHLDYSFDPIIIIYTKILCHLAYDTLDPICMILFICRRIPVSSHILSYVHSTKFCCVGISTSQSNHAMIFVHHDEKFPLHSWYGCIVEKPKASNAPFAVSIQTTNYHLKIAFFTYFPTVYHIIVFVVVAVIAHLLWQLSYQYILGIPQYVRHTGKVAKQWHH